MDIKLLNEINTFCNSHYNIVRMLYFFLTYVMSTNYYIIFSPVKKAIGNILFLNTVS